MNPKFTLLLLFVSLFISVHAQQIAFPGAEGAGRFASGGRGTSTIPTTVYEVTSLDDVNDNTPGTLRWAIRNNNPVATHRTVVFRISGTIRLNAPLTINRANTTIAGQTAPGDGICIADYPVTIGADNIIIRHIRFRLGDRHQQARNGSDDAISGTGRKNIIIDHCSISWSNDEALTVYSGDSTTLQWNMIYEPLDFSYHDEGSGVENHGYGGIWGGRRASLHHNLVAHVRGRAPRFDGNRNVTQENADFRNNVIYNWADYNVNGGEGGNYNVVNNYYKYGPNTPNNNTRGINRRNMIINPYSPYGKYYLTGNYVDNSATVTARNWLGAAMNSGSLADTNQAKVETPFDISPLNTQTALEAYEAVLSRAGATMPKRDTLDERVANDVRNRTGRIIDVQGGYPRGTPFTTSITAWPNLQTLPAPADTDKDGMPDAWETRRGLNPGNAADRSGTTANGYTNLENYLNGDSIVAMGNPNTCITARSIFSDGSQFWKHAADTTYATTIATDTLNLVASIQDNVNFGRFNIHYYTTNTIRTINGNPYLGRNVTIEALDPSLITVVATVRLYISQQEFAALQAADNTITSIADVRVVRTTDNNCVNEITGAYTVITPTATGVFGTYANGYFIEFQTPAFSTFFIAGPSIALPLHLVSFTGSYNGQEVRLRWHTENEVNTSHFEVEKSTDARTFEKIGTVNAAGNALSRQYDFTDIENLKQTTYYRLKMADKDGRYTFSNVLHFTAGKKGGLNIHPNPARDNIVLQHPKAKAGAMVTITTNGGKVVKQMTIPEGSVQTIVPLPALSKGAYVLLFVNEGSTISQQFLKQ